MTSLRLSYALILACFSMVALADQKTADILDRKARELLAAQEKAPPQFDKRSVRRILRALSKIKKLNASTLTTMADTCAIAGLHEITTDEVWSCKQAVVHEHAQINIRNGATLFFAADKEVNIQNSVEINVKDGSTLFIRTDRFTVDGNFRLDGSGNPGKKGGPVPHPKAAWASDALNNYWAFLKACKDNGYQAVECKGARGAKGESGGAGAVIVLTAKPTGAGEIKIDAFGGPGGSGGDGQTDYKAINSQNAACENCSQVMHPGDQGQTGRKGVDGGIFILE